MHPRSEQIRLQDTYYKGKPDENGMGRWNPRYRRVQKNKTMKMTLSLQDEQTTNTITTADLSINSQLVSTYSELVKSNNILGQVISNLGIDISESTLRNNISVSSVSDTELIKITVKTDNPKYSADIANETAKVFTSEVAEIYNINNVHVVDVAEESNVPSNIDHKKDIMMFAAIGVIIAFIYVIIAGMLDTTVKTEEEIERLVNLPVLASIPIYDVAESKKNKRRGRRRRWEKI